MDYIVHYDIAAIFVCILVNSLYFSKKHFATKADIYFRIMLVLLMFSSVADSVSVYTLSHVSEVPLWINYLVNGVFFLTFNSLHIVHFRYVLVITGYDIGKGSTFWKVISNGALAYIAGTILLTPFTKHAFYFADGVYHQGILLTSLYVVAFVMLVICVAFLVYSRSKLTTIQKTTTLLVALVSSGAVLFQFFFPEALITNFVAALLLMILYHSLQNPDEYLERDLKIFNQKAFLAYTDILVGRKKNFRVFAFQLEGFQFINQCLGIELGNKLLQSLVEEFQEKFTRNDLYYLGEMKFAYILEKDEGADRYLDYLKWRFLKPFSMQNEKINLTPRMVTVKCPEIADTPESILTAIDLSLTESKKKNLVDVFDTTKDAIDKRQRVTLVNHILQRAILNDEFEVHYQPIYSARDHHFSVAEALVRLTDPELGKISPEEFIPIAEKSGLILEIGEIVFRKVCRFIAANNIQQYGVRYIEVNLSMVQCMQENLHVQMTKIIEENKIPFGMIDFEITETSLNTDNMVLKQNMTNLINKGCTFAADDFGTGLSNADYLMKYPFEVVKLDKSFVWEADVNEKARKVLHHTTSMIGSLDLKIVAEGVESFEQAQALLAMGCQFLQGFYFSRPISESDYLSFLKRSKQIVAEKLTAPMLAKGLQ